MQPVTRDDVKRPMTNFDDTTDPMLRRVRARPRISAKRRRMIRRRGVAASVLIAALVAGVLVWNRDRPLLPEEERGSSEWAREHYGNPDAKGFKRRNIAEIEFLGRTMFVHEDAQRHFLRLE